MYKFYSYNHLSPVDRIVGVPQHILENNNFAIEALREKGSMSNPLAWMLKL
jgi:hypothetical protein